VIDFFVGLRQWRWLDGIAANNMFVEVLCRISIKPINGGGAAGRSA
jgi:hypothetical protein